MSAYRGEAVVRATYELEPEELLRHARGPRWKKATGGIRLFIAATVVLAGATMLLRVAPIGAAIGTLALAFCVAWLFRRTTRARPEEALLGRCWDERRHVVLEVDEDRFSMRSGIFVTELAWDVITHWEEKEDAFLVYPTADTFHVIPKRVLATAQMQTMLRQLLADRVSPGGQAQVDRNAARVWPMAIYFFVITLLLGALIEGLGAVLLPA